VQHGSLINERPALVPVSPVETQRPIEARRITGGNHRDGHETNIGERAPHQVDAPGGPHEITGREVERGTTHSNINAGSQVQRAAAATGIGSSQRTGQQNFCPRIRVVGAAGIGPSCRAQRPLFRDDLPTLIIKWHLDG
jgi:hypothetical protein